MWRWAFLPPQHQDRDELYSSLWRSLVRWLVTSAGMLPSQTLALKAEKCTFNTEEDAVVTLQVREDRWKGGVPQVELAGPAPAQSQTVACKPWGNASGQYHADLGRLAEGRYRVRVVGAGKAETATEAAFDVRGNLKERLDIAARPADMAWIAQVSGGAALEEAGPQDVAKVFDEHIQRSRPERVIRTAAWDRWWLLVGAGPLGNQLGHQTLVRVDVKHEKQHTPTSAALQSGPAAAADRRGWGLGLGTGCRRGPAGLRRLARSTLGAFATGADRTRLGHCGRRRGVAPPAGLSYRPRRTPGRLSPPPGPGGQLVRRNPYRLGARAGNPCIRHTPSTAWHCSRHTPCAGGRHTECACYFDRRADQHGGGPGRVAGLRRRWPKPFLPNRWAGHWPF